LTILRSTDDLMLECPKGNVPNHHCVNKFGRTTNADSGVLTDVWDGANATLNQPIWVAPTAARIHTLVSTSANDAAAGTGARTVRVYGLTSWDTSEVYEDVTMNGITGVAMTTAMVIIHRMEVLTKGAAGPNDGVITATAATDATITAQINNGAPGEGQTQMAIYGLPSIETAYMMDFYTSANRNVSTGGVDVRLLVNPTPDDELLAFVTKATASLILAGNSLHHHDYTPYLRIDGPAIIKVQVQTSANDFDVSAGFNMIRVRQ
jgi:hypothetical protein